MKPPPVNLAVYGVHAFEIKFKRLETNYADSKPSMSRTASHLRRFINHFKTYLCHAMPHSVFHFVICNLC